MFLYALGLGCIISSFWLFYLQGPLLAPVCALWNISAQLPFLYFLSSMSLTYLLLAQAIKVRSLRNKKNILTICGLVLSAAPLLTAVLPSFGLVHDQPLVIYLLAASSGAAQAIFFTAWMETIAACGLRQSCIIAGIAFLIGGCTASLGQLVNYLWLLPILTLLPLVSLVCLLHPLPTVLFVSKDYPHTNTVRLFPQKLIISLALVYLNGGIMLHILDLEQSYPHLFHWSYLAYVLFCPAMGLLLYTNENIDLRFMYRILLPLMFTGFMIFGFQESILQLAAFGLLQGGSALINMYVWLLFPYFARFSCRPAAVCAYGNFIISLCIINGGFIADLLTTVLLNSHNVRELAFTACIISAVLVFLFPGEKETFAGWQTVFAPEPLEPAYLPTSLDISATAEFPYELDKFALSKRELEVLVLLIKGRNGRFISEALNISGNTVKTHIRNIYGKLSVNDRQQLLSLFDNSETNISK